MSNEVSEIPEAPPLAVETLDFMQRHPELRALMRELPLGQRFSAEMHVSQACNRPSI